MKNPAYLAPVALPLWTFYPVYNTKLKAWDVEPYGIVTEVQPLGGNGRDADNIWPVPYVWKETNIKVFVKYHGVGMGDGPWKEEYFKTEAAARAAAVKWLNGRKAVTPTQRANLERDKKMDRLAKLRGQLEYTKEEVAKLEKELDEGVNPVNLAHGR